MGNYNEQRGDNNTISEVNQSSSGSGDNVARDKNEINQDDSSQQKESKIVKILGIAAAIATILSLFFSGIFSTEVKQWFDNLFDKGNPPISEPEKKPEKNPEKK